MQYFLFILLNCNLRMNDVLLLLLHLRLNKILYRSQKKKKKRRGDEVKEKLRGS